METPVHLPETMQSPNPVHNAQEQVVETPVLQAVPVQPATFQQPTVGSNGQGSDLQAMQQVFPPPSVHPGYFGGGSMFQSMAGHAPGNEFYTPGTVFGGAQTMMPNPIYGGIGLQPGFQSTHGQFGMPQASFGMAGIANQQPYMTSPGQFNSGQGTQINPNSVPMFQSLPYDNLTPLEKPTPYKEGGKGVTFTTFTGFDDRKKALSFSSSLTRPMQGGTLQRPLSFEDLKQPQLSIRKPLSISLCLEKLKPLDNSLDRVKRAWGSQKMGQWEVDMRQQMRPLDFCEDEEANDFRLFCGDLGNEVNDEVLTKAFSRYTTFNMARVVRDKRTGKTKGYGFVSFSTPSDLALALKEMNGKYVGNRPIKLRKSTWKERTDMEALSKHKHNKRLKTSKKNILHK
ncbi:hypothetical protein L7F22_020552 [Adiantum nelumboides]|nr:hypothetical protein [Adiantum nelumboides]